MHIREAEPDEFKRRAFRSQKTNEDAIEAVQKFIESGLSIAYVGGWQIRRTPAARHRALRKAIVDLGLLGEVRVKQANGSLYLIRLTPIEEVA